MSTINFINKQDLIFVLQIIHLTPFNTFPILIYKAVAYATAMLRFDNIILVKSQYYLVFSILNNITFSIVQLVILNNELVLYM